MRCSTCKTKMSFDLSPYIYGLAEIIRVCGFDLFSKELPLTTVGRINYSARWVKLSTSCARCSVLVLCHALGHLVHFLEEGPDLETIFTRAEREKAARQYGFIFVERLNIGITAAEWFRITDDKKTFKVAPESARPTRECLHKISTKCRIKGVSPAYSNLQGPLSKIDL